MLNFVISASYHRKDYVQRFFFEGGGIFDDETNSALSENNIIHFRISDFRSVLSVNQSINQPINH